MGEEKDPREKGREIGEAMRESTAIPPPGKLFTLHDEDAWKAAQDRGIQITEVLLKGDPEPIGRVESIDIMDGVWTIYYDAAGVAGVACVKESAIAGVCGVPKGRKKEAA
jgi:hypothetical protein